MKLFEKKTWTEGYGSLFVAILVALTIRWLLIEAYVIPSGSMLPTLLIRDHIFVNKLDYGIRVPFTRDWIVHFRDPKRGEVIVFRYPLNPSIFYIKRVIGVAGDQIALHQGQLYINGKPVPRHVALHDRGYAWLTDADFKDSYTKKSDYVPWRETVGNETHTILLRRGQALTPDYESGVVPKGDLFVLGDNRDNSEDSRFWKFVPIDNVIGKAMFVWLSCRKGWPLLQCNPFTIRWTRFFHVIH